MVNRCFRSKVTFPYTLVLIANTCCMMFLVCLVLMIAAPVIHIIWSVLSIKKYVRHSLAAIMVICLLIGIIFPVLATYLDILNLPPDTQCATSSTGFVVIGLAITGVVIPIIGLLFYAIMYHQQTKALKIDQHRI